MKTLLLTFLIPITLYTQTPLDSCMEAFLIARAKLKMTEDLLEISNKQLTLYRQNEVDYKQAIMNLKTALRLRDIPEPFMKWEGFIVGIGTAYYFDSTLIHNTLVNRLAYNGFIYGEGRVSIQSKLIFDGEVGIPFNDKFYIKVKAGYRIF